MVPMKVTFNRDPLFEDVKKFVQQQKIASCSNVIKRQAGAFNF